MKKYYAVRVFNDASNVHRYYEQFFFTEQEQQEFYEYVINELLFEAKMFIES